MTLMADWRTTTATVRRDAASMDGACSYDFMRRLGCSGPWSGSSSEDGTSDYPSFLRPAIVLLLSVVVPHFHPYARVCVFFSIRGYATNLPMCLGSGVGLDLV